MKRRWIALALLLALAVSLTACQVEFVPHGQPENNGDTTIDTPPLSGDNNDVADPADGVDPVGNVDPDDDDDYWGDIGFGSFSYSHPDAVYEVNRQYLDGTWVGTSVETADGRIPMETAGESLTLTFMSADGVTDFMGEGVWSMVCQYDATYSNGERETLNELYIKFLGGPMYHDCGNQEWFAALGGGPKGVEFNGDLTISGGTVAVWTANTADNQPLDADGTITVTGGTVFAASDVDRLRRAVGRPVVERPLVERGLTNHS